MKQRPTFFISSTIHDLRDLRGAIKFALEERGCRVLASEFNDFRGDLNRHSYDACLANIEQADYFVLLVGGRVGGWFDEANRISITRQEYRTAYERHRQGSLRIVTFVRAEVWQAREDRKDLARHLKEMALEEAEKAEIKSYSNKFVTDADFVSDFLTEIGRNRETIEAAEAGARRPTGNWIHQFRDFRDIHDVLSPLAFTGRTAEESAYAKALQHELQTVVARLLVKFQGNKVEDFSDVIAGFLRDFPIEKRQREEEWSAVDAARWRVFSSLMIQMLALKIRPVVLQDSLTSSLFLDYDASAGAYRHSPAYLALHQLVDEVRRLNEVASAETLSLVFDYSTKNTGKRTGEIHLPTQKLMMLYSLAQRWVNTLRLASALVVHLESRPFVQPTLLPFSPIKDMDESIDRERVTQEEARAFLGL